MTDTAIAPASSQSAFAGPPVSRAAVEDFLFAEARLLDRWMLNEWLELFSPDGKYLVAQAGVEDDVSPEDVLFYVDDDRFHLNERIARLYKRTAHAEYPHSKCRRMVGNVQIISSDGETFRVAANFIIFRTKSEKTDTYQGHYLYEMSLDGAGDIRIDKKTCYLDFANLYVQGKVSIIL